MLPDQEKGQRVAQQILQLCVDEGMDMLQMIGLFGLLTRGLINGAPGEVPHEEVDDMARAAFLQGLNAQVVLRIRAVPVKVH